jgi:superfamily II DNA or RNA helicase
MDLSRTIQAPGASWAGPFPQLTFRGQLRPSQTEVVEIARRQLAAGERRLHIVAPPGSGKTVLGLFLWAQCVKLPAVVLSPNSAIQAQWGARTDLFDGFPQGSNGDFVSLDPQQPAMLTSLTYQSLTLPTRATDDLDQQAGELWRERLLEKGQAKDLREAETWLRDLQQHNRDYYEQRLAAYRKQVRDAVAIGGDALKTLHASSRATLERLKKRGVGLVILDECHHLLGHWGRVLTDAHDLLAQPVIIGLTATPPDRDGKLPADILRYDELLGPVVYEVPVPAVVKDGFLAPYQDLAYFVRPTAAELSFIANADEAFTSLVEELCRPFPPDAPKAVKEQPSQELKTLSRECLTEWLTRILTQKRTPHGLAKDWLSFERRDVDFALAARKFLLSRQLPLPADVPPPEEEPKTDDEPEPLDMSVLSPVLDRYVRHRLRTSPDERDQKLADYVIGRLRMLGIQITETGWQACASPVGRVMAYSRSKCQALVPILSAEFRVLGEKMRAVVVADYEKSSATTAGIDDLLDAEAGGAIAAFKTLVQSPETDRLNPILVTGSSVLVDDDLEQVFLDEARAWLAKNEFEVRLEMSEEEGFHVVSGSGGDWCPRVYVEMITELFQRGVTRCLVGTRGLLGEGWDASKINVLIDLTTVTTSMTVNQLRGRSIRLDSGEPTKLANNWDVVCLAPEFSKGLDDYQRFRAKHGTLYGVTDDGAIEKGVGHVHPAFSRLRPEGLEGSVAALNEEMLSRASRREAVRGLWKIGQPYRNLPVRALEMRSRSEPDPRSFPPFSGSRSPWSNHSLSLAIGQAVLGALTEAGLVQRGPQIHVGERTGGYVRVFLEEASTEDSRIFTEALHEALGPMQQARYVIPRLVDRVTDTWLSSLLPSVVGHFFQKRSRRQAMLHAVPYALARNKEVVEIYERHWNRHVSPGQAIYALRGGADEEIERARRKGQLPKTWVQEKEIFL